VTRAAARPLRHGLTRRAIMMAMAGALPCALAFGDAEPPTYVRAGVDRLITACTLDGHTLSLVAHPGVALPGGARPAPDLPVDAFMDGAADVVRRQTAQVPVDDFLRPGSDGARRLSDAVEAWMDAFNVEHGSRMGWAIADFGVSDTPQAACRHTLP
jgi:hypothetical protein